MGPNTTTTDPHNLYDHRRSLSINPPPPAPDDSTTGPMSMYATMGYQRGSNNIIGSGVGVGVGVGVGAGMGPTSGLGIHHHSSNPNLYSMWDYRRGVTSTTLMNPSLYATLPNRRDNHSSFASSMSVSNMNNNNGSPPGFRDFRRSLVTPLIRRPNESVV
ncbi:hypothetical protein Pcinc_033921 [Petrolisthes cinctipes]|uniref:Uncharacterized protein n=1 Tax=Petrolisthes cinctipes TaxID=88211 RepID=A0AAE1ER71_PETCI|nr:hypothetical protein Pcinc_033921 [Petrolisthes cinctipes]